MARIFLSHSSVDNAAAIALAEWLRQNGWDDIFLDLDPERGIAAGELWERALSEAAQRCEAVIFLLSPSWAASQWCRREFHLAQRMNKRIFGVMVAEVDLGALPPELTGAWQVVGLASGTDHKMMRVRDPRTGREEHVTFSTFGLQSLRAGLERAGLDPRFFAWPPAEDPGRAPYRGLRPLEADDAGIFFGREAAIIQGLDVLRGLRQAAPPRLLAILGASGAGKSSFLRAGLLPRLQRDDRNFLALPPIRPERAVISGETGLVQALLAAFRRQGSSRTRAAIRDAVAAGGGALRDLLREVSAVREATAATGAGAAPTVVLSIDQAEELFGAEGAQEASGFLGLIGGLAAAVEPAVICIFTIRSDSYENLQNAAQLEGLQQVPFSLPPLPRGAFKTVIEGPAQRFSEAERRLVVEPALTNALLEDVEKGGGKDALPLLAFTLERLFIDYGDSGHLRFEEYEALGRIRGSINASVARAMRAADSDDRIPRDGEARRALIRRGLIPWLAGIDPESGAPRRRVARWGEIPEEARPMVGHLVDARLLSTDIDPETGERTVEPAHEAVLRQWGLLQGWLDEAFADLSTAEGVKRATRDWLANGRTDDWLSHAGGRLEDAEALRTSVDMASFLAAEEWAYVAACRRIEDQRRDRELQQARALAEAQRLATEEQRRTAFEQTRVARRTRMGLGVALVLMLASALLAVWGFDRAGDAARQAATARQAEQAARAAQQEALAAEQQAQGEAARADAAREQAQVMASHLTAPLVDEGRPDLALAITAGLVADASRVSPALDAVIRRAYHDLAQPLERPVSGYAFSYAISPDGSVLAVGTAGGEETEGWVHLFALPGLKETGRFRALDGPVTSLAFSPNGKGLVAAGAAQASLWEVDSGTRVFDLVLPEGRGWTKSAAFSPDGRWILVSSNTNGALVFDAESGAAAHRLEGVGFDALLAGITARGGGGEDPILRAVSQATFTIFGGATDIAISPDGTLAAVSGAAIPDGSVLVFDIATGSMLRRLEPDGGPQDILGGVMGYRAVLHFSPDGRRVISGITGDDLRVWRVADGHLEVGIPAAGLTAMQLVGEGRAVISAHRDGSVRAFCLDAPENRLALSAHAGLIHDITVDEASGLFVTTSEDAFVKVWRLPEIDRICGPEDDSAGADPFASLEPLRAFRGPRGAIHSAAVLPDGENVLSVSQDGIVRSFPLAAQARRHLARDREGGRSSAKRVEGPAWGDPPPLFSADGDLVFIGPAAWSSASGLPVDLPGEIDAVAADPDSGRTTLFSSFSRRWDLGQLPAEPSLDDSPSGSDSLNGYVSGAMIAPDATRILLSETDWERDIRVHLLADGTTGKAIAVLDDAGNETSEVTFSPDSSRIVGIGPRGLQLWDATDGKWLGAASSLATAQYPMLAISDRARRVVLAGPHQGELVSVEFREDGTATLDRVPAQASDSDAVTALDLSRDGRVALAGGAAGLVTVHDFADFSAGRQVTVGTGEVVAVHISRDRRLGAAVDAHGEVAVFELATGAVLRRDRLRKEPAQPGDAPAPYGHARFDPRGRFLVACAGGLGCMLFDISGPGRWSDRRRPLLWPAAFRPPSDSLEVRVDRVTGRIADDGRSFHIRFRAQPMTAWDLSTGSRISVPAGVETVIAGTDGLTRGYSDTGLEIDLATADAPPGTLPEREEAGTLGVKNPHDNFPHEHSPRPGRAIYFRSEALDADLPDAGTGGPPVTDRPDRAEPSSRFGDGNARWFLFDTQERRTIRELELPDGVSAEEMHFSPDGTRIVGILGDPANSSPGVSLGEDPARYVFGAWDSATGEALAFHDHIGETASPELRGSASGSRFLIGHPAREKAPSLLALADPEFTDGLHQLPPPATDKPVTAFRLGADGLSAVYGHADGTVSFLRSLNEPAVRIESRIDTVTEIYLSPDGRTVVAIDDTGSFSVIDTVAAQVVRRTKLLTPVVSVDFVRSSSFFVICEWSRACSVVDGFADGAGRPSIETILSGYLEHRPGHVTEAERRLYGLQLP